MKLNTINLQVVINLGNYETMRLGAEWTPDENQTLDEAMAMADRELRDAAAKVLDERKNPQPQPTRQQAIEAEEQTAKVEAEAAKSAENPDLEEDARELVAFNTKKFANIIKRIEAGVPLSTVEQHFKFDAEGTRLVAELCEKLNKKQ